MAKADLDKVVNNLMEMVKRDAEHFGRTDGELRNAFEIILKRVGEIRDAYFTRCAEHKIEIGARSRDIADLQGELNKVKERLSYWRSELELAMARAKADVDKLNMQYVVAVRDRCEAVDELKHARQEYRKAMDEMATRLKSANAENARLREQLAEKEELLAGVTDVVAAAEEQQAEESKVATRAIGTPRADDVEKALGGTINVVFDELKTKHDWVAIAPARRVDVPIDKAEMRAIAAEEAHRVFHRLYEKERGNLEIHIRDRINGTIGNAIRRELGKIFTVG